MVVIGCKYHPKTAKYPSLRYEKIRLMHYQIEGKKIKK